MARVHGKKTTISIDGDDITTYCDTSELTREADEHDVSTYGPDDAEYDGGLKRGSFTMGGLYGTGATGPGAILRPLIGTVVEVIRKPEGDGVGKPIETFDVLVKKYVETAPVADYVRWSAECTKTGAIADTVGA